MFTKSKNDVTVDVLEKCVPIIYINNNALAKMYIYTQNCANEIGWLGTAVKNETKNIIYIEDTILFEQEVHSATTELTPEGLAKFGEELLKQKNGIETWNKIKVWGHSHVNMTASPSGQDDKQMETFAEGGHDWFARIITNKNNDMRVDLYLYDLGIIFNNIPWYKYSSKEEMKIENQINILLEKLEAFQEERINKFEKEITSEIKTKVKEKTYNYNNYYGRTSYGTAYGEKKKDSNYYNGFAIKNSEDVYKHFTHEELLDLGECQDLNELRETINIYNNIYYNNNELLIIWQVTKELIQNIYFNS